MSQAKERHETEVRIDRDKFHEELQSMMYACVIVGGAYGAMFGAVAMLISSNHGLDPLPSITVVCVLSLVVIGYGKRMFANASERAEDAEEEAP